MKKLRVILADDHAALREGLRMLIDAQADMEVVAQADNGRKLLTLIGECPADVVVVDISMPEMNGARAAEAVKQKCPQTKVLALTRHTDIGYLRRMLEAGASGYITKRAASEELVKAIRAVSAGETYLDPSLSGKVAAQFVTKTNLKSTYAASNLTGRETEILRLVAWGYANKEIAHQLNISVKTVETHKAHAMEKIELRTRADVVRYALLQGWMEEEE
jgi:two-component system, NarL family, response regulator NreC